MEQDIQAAESLREGLSLLLNAPSSERITFQSNTSAGLSVVAQGLNWSKGDEILIPDVEFPSNVYPWQTVAQEKQLQITRIPTKHGRLTANHIEEYITPHTKLLALSAVQFLSGYRADLQTIGTLCKDRDIWFVVDGIQAVGAVQIDVSQMHIDALAGGGHKWLMSPMGMGYLYVSESMQSAIHKQSVGWLSVEEPWELFNTDQSLHPHAQRFELGTPNMYGIHGMLAAVRLHLELGPDSIEHQLSKLTQFLLRHTPSYLKPVTPEDNTQRAGIVSFQLPGQVDPEELKAHLQHHQIDIAIRQGLLRIAPHFYITISELNILIEVLDQFIKD
jgi:selenocysteine lyase/cysteine desulfurase